jgi:ribosomal protein S18 acetylase RimI-like enzyme
MLRIEVYGNGIPMESTCSITRLIQKQMESIGSPKTTEQIEQTISNIFNSNNRAMLFAGYDAGGIPVAFAFGNLGVGFEAGGDYFWLNELYVDINCRRQGCAGEMLSFIEKWLKDKEINYIACVTGRENAAAQNMYKNNGFDLNAVIWVDKKI